MKTEEIKIKLFDLRREIDTLNAIQQQKVQEYNKLMETLIATENENKTEVQLGTKDESKNGHGDDSSGQEGEDKGVSESPK